MPFWVVLACQAAMALGTLMGGWRIVRTMGLRITKLTPMQGFCAETGGAATLFMATYLGVPVSTTHTITGAIVGVGAARRVSAVRWNVASSIVYAWVITIPASAIVAALAYWAVLLRAIGHAAEVGVAAVKSLYPEWFFASLDSARFPCHTLSSCPTLPFRPNRRPGRRLQTEVARRRTFAIISHPDAGKTTLTEKLLLFGGAINLAGQVKAKGERRNTRSDWMKIERERGISVVTSVMTFEFEDLVFNLLDTPGHEDFSEDTYRTLTAVDSAVMVIDAAKGIEART